MRLVQACHPAAHAAGQEVGAGAVPWAPPESLLLASPQPAAAVIRATITSAGSSRLRGCPSERVVRLLYPRAMGDNYTPRWRGVRHQASGVKTTTEGQLMKSVRSRALAAAALLAGLAFAAGCGSSSGGGSGGPGGGGGG